MKRRAFIGATAGATAAAALPSASRAQIVGQYLQQLTIGVSVPLTGDYASYGKDVLRGVQAAIQETNRFNISLKYTWAARSFDDQNNGQVAVTNAQVGTSDQTIIGMVGDLTGGATVQALPAYANAGMALIVPTVTDDLLTKLGYRNVFRLPTKNTTLGQLMSQTLLPKKAPATAVAVTLNGPYGPDIAAGFVQQAKSDKHDAYLVTLDAKVPIDPGNAARDILGHTPTHVALCGGPDDLGPVAEALRLAGYTGEFSLSDRFYTQAVLDKYAKLFDGVNVASSYPPVNRVPMFSTVFGDFQQAVGPVNAFLAYGYAAAQLIIAAQQLNTATSRFSLLSNLRTGTTFNTLVGEYIFNVNGDAVLPNIYFYKIGKDGFSYSKAAIPTGFVL